MLNYIFGQVFFHHIVAVFVYFVNSLRTLPNYFKVELLLNLKEPGRPGHEGIKQIESSFIMLGKILQN